MRTAQGELRAEVVINCAGMWAHELGARAGTTVPLHAAEHFYIVTEPMPGLSSGMPVLRDPDSCAYFKEDAGKLLVGWFEPVAKPWGMRGIPETFCFDTLPEDLEHIEPLLNAAMHRTPAPAASPWTMFFNRSTPCPPASPCPRAVKNRGAPATPSGAPATPCPNRSPSSMPMISTARNLSPGWEIS